MLSGPLGWILITYELNYSSKVTLDNESRVTIILDPL